MPPLSSFSLTGIVSPKTLRAVARAEAALVVAWALREHADEYYAELIRTSTDPKHVIQPRLVVDSALSPEERVEKLIELWTKAKEFEFYSSEGQWRMMLWLTCTRGKKQSVMLSYQPSVTEALAEAFCRRAVEASDGALVFPQVPAFVGEEAQAILDAADELAARVEARTKAKSAVRTVEPWFVLDPVYEASAFSAAF